jgi:hypothetical protein
MRRQGLDLLDQTRQALAGAPGCAEGTPEWLDRGLRSGGLEPIADTIHRTSPMVLKHAGGTGFMLEDRTSVALAEKTGFALADRTGFALADKTGFALADRTGFALAD